MSRFPLPSFWQSVRFGWAVVLLLGASGLVLGCGRGSFVGRQYDDFTAYYNTFHNAQDAFEKGVKSVDQSLGTSVDRTRYISLFPDIQASSGGSSFKKAIQKSADVLRKHPNSKWVDDALLLIGRSRYYQQNYVGAVQKFREVIALRGEREGEARFRLAKTLVAADRYSEAAEALRAGLEQDAEYGTWTARMRLVRGQLLVRQGEWAEAEQALAEGLAGSLPDELRARAALLLGQVRETQEDFGEAQVAYQRAAEYSPTYQLEFAARLGAIEMQGLSGNPNEALDRLESLERGDDTNAMRGKIARVRARLYRELGQSEKAKQALASVLRGEEAPTGRVQGRIHYDLATLYRDRYEDFTQAAAHFDTAATTLSSGSGRGGTGGETDARALPRAPSDAAAQAERFQGLADRSRAVARMDSLLRVGRMPPAEYQAFVQRLREKRLEEQKREARARRRRSQQFQRGTQAGGGRTQGAGAQQSAVQTRGSDAGFLFHRDPTLVQQGRRQFEQTWGDRPLVDNWRRVNAIEGTTASPAAQEEDRTEGTPRGGGASEAALDLSAVPRDSASQAQMEKKRAVARYELAMALYRAASRPDSAETWFRRVLTENERHPVARKALYGLAQVHRAQGDTAAAERAYRRLIERHPGTRYAARARDQLGLERAEPASGTEASKADSVYARGYEQWQSGALDPALNTFLAVAESYPETDAAPRALLAAGVVYHRAAGDSTGAGQTRLRHFADSLAQSSEGGPTAQADTTPQSAAPQNRPSGDTTEVRAPPRTPADTTRTPTDTTMSVARPQADARQAIPEGDTTEGAPTPPERPVSDTVSREQSQTRPRPRRVDSSAMAEQDRRVRRPDREAGDPGALVSDTTRRGGAEESAASTVASDSSQGPTRTRKASKDPLEILLTHLTERYVDTPEAKRAQKLLAYLNQKKTPRDSTASDSSALGAPSAADASPDSSAMRTSSNSPAAADDGPRTPARSPDSTARPRRPSSEAPRSRGGASRPSRDSGSPAKTVQDSSAVEVRDSTRTESPRPGPAPDSSGTGDED